MDFESAPWPNAKAEFKDFIDAVNEKGSQRVVLPEQGSFKTFVSRLRHAFGPGYRTLVKDGYVYVDKNPNPRKRAAPKGPRKPPKSEVLIGGS